MISSIIKLKNDSIIKLSNFVKGPTLLVSVIRIGLVAISFLFLFLLCKKINTYSKKQYYLAQGGLFYRILRGCNRMLTVVIQYIIRHFIELGLVDPANKRVLVAIIVEIIMRITLILMIKKCYDYYSFIFHSFINSVINLRRGLFYLTTDRRQLGRPLRLPTWDWRRFAEFIDRWITNPQFYIRKAKISEAIEALHLPLHNFYDGDGEVGLTEVENRDQVILLDGAVLIKKTGRIDSDDNFSAGDEMVGLSEVENLDQVIPLDDEVCDLDPILQYGSDHEPTTIEHLLPLLSYGSDHEPITIEQLLPLLRQAKQLEGTPHQSKTWSFIPLLRELENAFIREHPSILLKRLKADLAEGLIERESLPPNLLALLEDQLNDFSIFLKKLKAGLAEGLIDRVSIPTGMLALVEDQIFLSETGSRNNDVGKTTFFEDTMGDNFYAGDAGDEVVGSSQIDILLDGAVLIKKSPLEDEYDEVYDLDSNISLFSSGGSFLDSNLNLEGLGLTPSLDGELDGSDSNLSLDGELDGPDSNLSLYGELDGPDSPLLIGSEVYDLSNLGSEVYDLSNLPLDDEVDETTKIKVEYVETKINLLEYGIGSRFHLSFIKQTLENIDPTNVLGIKSGHNVIDQLRKLIPVHMQGARLSELSQRLTDIMESLINAFSESTSVPHPVNVHPYSQLSALLHQLAQSSIRKAKIIEAIDALHLPLHNFYAGDGVVGPSEVENQDQVILLDSAVLIKKSPLEGEVYDLDSNLPLDGEVDSEVYDLVYTIDSGLPEMVNIGPNLPLEIDYTKQILFDELVGKEIKKFIDRHSKLLVEGNGRHYVAWLKNRVNRDFTKENVDEGAGLVPDLTMGDILVTGKKGINRILSTSVTSIQPYVVNQLRRVTTACDNALVALWSVLLHSVRSIRRVTTGFDLHVPVPPANDDLDSTPSFDLHVPVPPANDDLDSTPPIDSAVILKKQDDVILLEQDLDSTPSIDSAVILKKQDDVILKESIPEIRKSVTTLEYYVLDPLRKAASAYDSNVIEWQSEFIENTYIVQSINKYLADPHRGEGISRFYRSIRQLIKDFIGIKPLDN